MRKIIHSKKVYIIILLVILLFTIWYIGGSGKNVERDLFNDIYGFELPDSAVFEEFNAKGVQNYKAKIVVKQSDLDYIYEGFKETFKRPATKLNPVNSERGLKGLKNIVSWLDLDYKDIDVCYDRFDDARKGMGGEIESIIENTIYIRINDDDTATMYVIVV